MLFNSQIFVFLFFPITLLGYYALHRFGRHTAAKGWLLLASFVFYGYHHVSYLLLLLGSIAINYLIYLALGKLSSQKARLFLFVLGLLANLGSIGYFKYYNFFAKNINTILPVSIPLKNILLPLGISFFTFQQVSFLVDSYRKEVGTYHLLDYALFVSFFPQLVAGPIVLHNHLIPQFSEEERFHIDTDRFAAGLRYFILGLAKKQLIADRFGAVADLGYASPEAFDSPAIALVILAYTLQIYYDFSGYSDMAIGLGKMLGFDLPVNFDSPYKAATIAEFWKKWHMTMTGFFTKYLYIPLGGSRKGKIRTYINTLFVFAVSGLWHGAAWSFVFWGALHGAALVFHRMIAEPIKKVPKWITRLCTFLFVNLAWVFFRAEGFRQAKTVLLQLLRGGFGGKTGGIWDRLLPAFFGSSTDQLLVNFPELADGYAFFVSLTALVAIVLILIYTFVGRSTHEIVAEGKAKSGTGILYGLLFAVTLLALMKVSTFLYFNF